MRDETEPGDLQGRERRSQETEGSLSDEVGQLDREHNYNAN